MDTSEKVNLVKSKTGKLTDAARNLLRFRETNEIGLYSDTISSQLPRSYAVHSFNALKYALLCNELVCLCAIWDAAKTLKLARDRDSIPAVSYLLDDAVVRRLRDEARDWHPGYDIGRVVASDDTPERKALIQKALDSMADQKVQENSDQVADWIERARDKIAEVQTSGILASIKLYRDRNIAHLLTVEKPQRQASARSMKYGDEAILFDRTIEVIDLLHLAINGSDFAWDGAREFARRSAKAFWEGVKIDVIE